MPEAPRPIVLTPELIDHFSRHQSDFASLGPYLDPEVFRAIAIHIAAQQGFYFGELPKRVEVSYEDESL